MTTCGNCIFWTIAYEGLCHHYKKEDGEIPCEEDIDKFLRLKNSSVCDHFVPREELRRLDAAYIKRDKLKDLPQEDIKFLKEALKEFEICKRPTEKMLKIEFNLNILLLEE
jgi:hypothetical protein